MEWKREGQSLAWIIVAFAAFFWLPVGEPRFDQGLIEALELTKWYTREHVILCLIPAFFIAGAISVFVSQNSVMKYLGARAPKAVAYGVASVSGTILAVCSCTVLPLFAGIWRMGAGLGPATAFLYSGPAINVLAIVLTARILGLELGIARALGAVVFSVVIGLAMHLIYRREEQIKLQEQLHLPEPQATRPLWKTLLYFAAMIGILIFANWGKPAETTGLWAEIFALRWWFTSAFAVGLALTLSLWFGLAWRKLTAVGLITAALAIMFPHEPMIAFLTAAVGLSLLTAAHQGEAGQWFASTWTFAKQILPLLLVGVLVSGFLLGRPGHEGVIPSTWIQWAVGGNSPRANFCAALVGAFMYFATLTEVPILQGLIGSGMGKGPALALLLAGPALSLPSMLVLRSIMGIQKTVVYCALVVIMATLSGLVYGAWW
ncbi:MAG: permease [Phycisphaeraceae bacterium]|nr:permease [Phycisphaeraceae bacterium]